MHASNVSNLLFEQLKFRGDRQKVIASNIANLNTPGYKTKELSFDGHLENIKQQNSLSLTVTHKNHISFDNSQRTNLSSSKVYEVKGLEEQNDGNNVNLDTQISEMSKNSVMTDAITNSIKKDSRWFKMIVEASGKN
ncbi:MAG: flagellar basal body rod protein FlgB [Arcobacteraceae bacterium]|nr:flagellar basal body rod protein FlgB [Arcobacteraceae bacterium]